MSTPGELRLGLAPRTSAVNPANEWGGMRGEPDMVGGDGIISRRSQREDNTDSRED
jgi:hypothetical protein